MINPLDRQKAVVLIDEAHAAGTRKWRACKTLEISVRSYQRWERDGYDDKRQTRVQTPANQLTDAERQAVLDCCNQEENASLSPKQIVPRLANAGEYLASESTFYRILRAEDQLNHRGRAARPDEEESSESAADLLAKIHLREGLSTVLPVALHSDNGSPMKGATMQKLGVVPSFSRPSVSNDNAFSE
jgi:putative transposase